MKRLIKLLIAFAAVIALLPVLLHKTGFFVVNKPVKSNILIIEGWLSSNAINDPPFDYNNYDTIFLVGVKNRYRWDLMEEKRQRAPEETPDDYARLITNGYLFLRGYGEKNIADTISTVSVVAKGSAVKGEFAHFFLSVKDSMFGHTSVNDQIDTFTFKVNLPPNKIADLNLYFNNDRQTSSEDINLRVYKIMLDTFSFLPLKNEFFYFGRNLHSSAQMNANHLASQPNIKAKIIVVDTLHRRLNNTFTSARALNRYLHKNKIILKSVNIYTYPTHSRRSKMAYEKALPLNVNVGTYIAKSDHIESHIHWYLAALDETIRWIGTIFLPRSAE